MFAGQGAIDGLQFQELRGRAENWPTCSGAGRPGASVFVRCRASRPGLSNPAYMTTETPGTRAVDGRGNVSVTERYSLRARPLRSYSPPRGMSAR